MDAHGLRRLVADKRQILIRCPVPGHGKGRGDINPSLSVAIGENGKLLVNCFAGCNYHDVSTALGLVAGAEAGRSDPGAHAPTGQDRHWRSAWDEGRPVLDTPAQTYLVAHRKVTRVDSLAALGSAALRFHPRAPFHKTGDWRVPGLMAAVTSSDGAFIGLQVTGLRPDGRGKIDARKQRHIFGRVSGGAVRLGAPMSGRRQSALAIGEGLESALGFASLSGYPCWAALGSSLRGFHPPDDIDELVIAADNDQAGLGHAEVLSRRVQRPGRLVEIRHPERLGEDWADVASRLAMQT
jgi:hypothetical protein